MCLSLTFLLYGDKNQYSLTCVAHCRGRKLFGQLQTLLHCKHLIQIRDLPSNRHVEHMVCGIAARRKLQVLLSKSSPVIGKTSSGHPPDQTLAGGCVAAVWAGAGLAALLAESPVTWQAVAAGGAAHA